MSILARARPDLASFRAYVSARSTGLDAPIRLNANESPRSIDGDRNGCNRYPDPQPHELRTRLAALYGTRPGRVWLGRGSDEAIDLLLRGFCRAGRDNVVAFAPTFGMYRIGAALQNAEYRELALHGDDGFALDPERLLALVDDDTRLVIVCSPNNPTGTLHHNALRMLAERLRDRALLVVDEAYIEFADATSAIALIDEFEHVAVLRTLSKAHALAGARVGALIANDDVIAFIGRIAAPYPLPTPSVALALAALSPDALRATAARVEQLIAERERVARLLASMRGVTEVWPSQANFILARFADADDAFHRALAAGVLVRDVSAQPGLNDTLRLTIGMQNENDALLDALDSIGVTPRRRADTSDSRASIVESS